ncbi:hypothetical protein BDZ91DRAFT_786275 [Kalaharituber pfeilii]|nr:hypothetical protein BDZ91DRAFT_786275 [Kalaharituber pfeilii]
MTIDMSDEPVGKALLLKITGNTFIGSMVETLAEGLVFAEKSGGGYLRQEPLFSVPLALKDVNHALKLALASGCPDVLKITKTLEEHLEKVSAAAGDGRPAENCDFAGVYGVVRTDAGLPFDNGSLGNEK